MKLESAHIGDKQCHDKEPGQSREQDISDTEQNGNKNEANVETNDDQGDSSCQQTLFEEAKKTNDKCRDAKKSMSLKLMTAKFSSIIGLKKRQKGDSSVTEHKEKHIRERAKDRKIKLFKGPDRLKRQPGSTSADEAWLPLRSEIQDDRHLGIVSERNCAATESLARQNLPNSCTENPNTCSESVCKDDAENDCKNLENPLLRDHTPMEIISVLSEKLGDVVEFCENPSLDIGQEVVGYFEFELTCPKRNLGNFLRRPFRKLQEGPESSLRRDTLVEPCGAQGFSSEGERGMLNIPATKSVATVSTKSLDDYSACAAKPDHHQRRSDISIDAKSEIRRLITDMATLRKTSFETQPLKKSLKMLIAKERQREDNRKTSGQGKTSVLSNVTDDFANIFSCACQAQ